MDTVLSRPVSGKRNLNSILALAGIVGPIVLIAAEIFVAQSDPFYDPLRHTISSLAWANLGWLQTIGFLAIGLLTEIFIAGLFFNIHGKKGFGIGIALLSMFGFGLLLIGAFHTDPLNGPTTLEGSIHGLAAASIFWIFAIALLLIAPSLKSDPYWKSMFLYSLVSSGIAIFIMVASFWVKPDFRFYGLFERILVADEIIWVAFMALKLFRKSLQAED